MSRTSTVVQWLIRLGAVVQLGLGGLFWAGSQLQLIPVHMLVGMIVVLGLLVQAVLGAFARAGWMRVAAAVVWAPVVIWLGMNQATVLEGDLHWVVQVLHLAVGLAAVAQAEMLARWVRARRGGESVAPVGGAV